MLSPKELYEEYSINPCTSSLASPYTQLSSSEVFDSIPAGQMGAGTPMNWSRIISFFKHVKYPCFNSAPGYRAIFLTGKNKLGLTFKSGSDDLRGSGAIILNKKLQQKGFEVLPVDPHVNKSEINFKTFDYQKIKHKTNNILIAVNHGEFNKYDLKNKIIVYGEL